MKTWNRRMNATEIPLLPLFVCCVVVAMIVTFTQKSDLLLHSTVLNEETLGFLLRRTGDSKALFLYVVKERSWVLLVLFLLSGTYLATLCIYGTVIWYGTGIGTLLAIALMRYGFSGILLLMAAGLPQYLLYVPAMMITLQLCKEKREISRKLFLQFGLMETVVIIGCFLESYVNLMLVEKILEKFF